MTIQCPHDGYHRTDADLAACLRERVDAYREKESELFLIRAALGIKENLDKARAVGFAGLIMVERGDAKRVAAVLRVALPTSESGAQTMAETVVRQRDELALAGIAAAEVLRGLQQNAADARVLKRLDDAIAGGR